MKLRFTTPYRPEIVFHQDKNQKNVLYELGHRNRHHFVQVNRKNKIHYNLKFIRY